MVVVVVYTPKTESHKLPYTTGRPVTFKLIFFSLAVKYTLSPHPNQAKKNLTWQFGPENI